jgi:hypothetical protein
MADQPYDPYIPQGGAGGSGAGAGAGNPGNQRTAAIQAVGLFSLLLSFLYFSSFFAPRTEPPPLFDCDRGPLFLNFLGA